MTVIVELRQPLWMRTPRGEALALLLTDYGPESDHLWTCVQQQEPHVGELWSWHNSEVRLMANSSMLRGRPMEPGQETAKLASDPEVTVTYGMGDRPPLRPEGPACTVAWGDGQGSCGPEGDGGTTDCTASVMTGEPGKCASEPERLDTTSREREELRHALSVTQHALREATARVLRTARARNAWRFAALMGWLVGVLTITLRLSQ